MIQNNNDDDNDPLMVLIKMITVWKSYSLRMDYFGIVIPPNHIPRFGRSEKL